jgi:hypothetical protein
LFEVDLDPEDAFVASVAAAKTTSLGALLLDLPAGPVSVKAFDGASGATPVWVYAFDELYDDSEYRCVDVSADGSVVAALANSSITPYPSRLVILDGASGSVLGHRDFEGFAGGVELSDSGARAVVSGGSGLGMTATVLEIPSMTESFSFYTFGGGAMARIAGNGRVVAGGVFGIAAYRDTGSGWVQAYYQADPSELYGHGVALSADGSTMMAASLDYQTEECTFRVVDLEMGVELGRFTTIPTGTLQDGLERAEASADGSILAVATWGQETNPHAEVLVFDRTATPVGAIDMPGSCFWLDMTRDGRYVVAGGKRVHANTAGCGGDAFALELDHAWIDTPQGECTLLSPLRIAPTPTTAAASISLALQKRGKLSLAVYDASGRLVRALLAGAAVEAGEHRASWDGRDSFGSEVPCGVYFARATVNGATAQGRIVLVR